MKNHRLFSCYLFIFFCISSCANLRPIPTANYSTLDKLPERSGVKQAWMNPSISPCEDFYTYACGRWEEENPIPPDEPYWGLVEKISQDNLQLLLGLVTKAADTGKPHSQSEQKIGDSFAACMDTEAIEKAGIHPLQPYMDQIQKIRSFEDLTRVIGQLQRIIHKRSSWYSGKEILLGLGVQRDFHDPTKTSAFVFSGGLGLPNRSFYINKEKESLTLLNDYRHYIQTLLRLSGVPQKKVATQAEQILVIEEALAQASLAKQEKFNPFNLDHPMSLEALQQLTPSFPWVIYLNEIGAPSLASLNVNEPNFLSTIQSLLQTQPLEAWKAYLRFHVIHARTEDLSSPFVQARFLLDQKLSGVKEPRPRWKYCAQRLDEDVGELLGQAYIDKAFSEEQKQEALTMANQIKARMKAHLLNRPWLEEATKLEAVAKLETITSKIGFPDIWRDYSTLVIARHDHFGNVNRSAAFQTQRKLRQIGKPVDQDEWLLTPQTVNAFYDDTQNSLNFPAGILQPPMFGAGRNLALNFGYMGTLMGHEISHGFDTVGSAFDAKGLLRHWLSKTDQEKFIKGAQCIKDQFSQYKIKVRDDNISVNGELTLSENIADLAGITLSYEAWKEASAGKPSSTKTNGFTDDQLFFIASAQWYCSQEQEEEKRMLAITDSHAPNKYRVNGPLSNRPEFARAFSCTDGQPMVRKQRCEVW